MAKARSRVSPVAIRRALYADRWVPRYRAALQRELNRQVRQVASEALTLTPDTARHVTQWSEALDRVKKRWVYPIVITGYELAGREVTRIEEGGKSSSKVLGKADVLVPPSVSIGREEGGQFLLRGDFESIDQWVSTTSIGESQTSAKKLEKIWKDAVASRDPETGAAWTPDQISKRILRRGLVGNRHRADMLARTGAIWSVNEGAQQRYRAAGVKAERWLTTKDDALCFPGDAKISVPGGTMPIEGIRVGDVVLTRSGLHVVSRTMSRLYEGNFVILTSRIGTLTCTLEHPIWVRSTGWTKAEEIQEGDILSLVHGEEAEVLLEVYITPQVEARVYNLEIEDDHTFFANGVLVHNCPYCAGMDGKVVSIDEPFWPAGSEYGNPAQVDQSLKLPYDVQHPPLHPRCLVGETPIIAVDKIAGLVTAYSGPVIDITLSNSRRVTVTPNHMFLTTGGFARAASLREGDNILDGSAFERIVSANPDDDRKPTAIKDVVESLAKSLGMSPTGVPVTAEDLHGDAAFTDGKVNIIGPDGFLWRDGKTSSAKPIFQTNLDAASVRESLFNGDGDLASVLFALMLASDGGMGVRCEGSTFLRRESLHSELVRITGGAYADASLYEASQNTCAANIKGLGERKLRLPFDVPTTHVTGLRVRQFSGHVYDLQSSTTLYIANGLVSSNCRCSLIPVILPGETVSTPEIKLPTRGVARSVKPTPKPKPIPIPELKPIPEYKKAETLDEALQNTADSFGNQVIVTTEDTVGKSAVVIENVTESIDTINSEVLRLRHKYPRFNRWAQSPKTLDNISVTSKSFFKHPDGNISPGQFAWNSQKMRIAQGTSLQTGKLKLGSQPFSMSGGGVDGVFRHETGHAFHKSFSANRHEQWFKIYNEHSTPWWKETVSQYAPSTHKEAFAECFTAYTHADYGKVGVTRLPVDIEKFLDTIVKGVR